MTGVFHNGWTTFGESGVRLEDKMEVQKKNSKKPSAEIVKFRHYTTEELCTIPFIFVDE